MKYEKNLIVERKEIFSTLDVAGLLNIENLSFLSSGNILLSGSMSASHADFEKLYADMLYCNQGSFNFIEFDGQWS